MVDPNRRHREAIEAVDRATFVCIECGQKCMSRSILEAHFRLNRHGPTAVQSDAIDRARASVLGDDT